MAEHVLVSMKKSSDMLSFDFTRSVIQPLSVSLRPSHAECVESFLPIPPAEMRQDPSCIARDKFFFKVVSNGNLTGATRVRAPGEEGFCSGDMGIKAHAILAIDENDRTILVDAASANAMTSATSLVNVLRMIGSSAEDLCGVMVWESAERLRFHVDSSFVPADVVDTVVDQVLDELMSATPDHDGRVRISNDDEHCAARMSFLRNIEGSILNGIREVGNAITCTVMIEGKGIIKAGFELSSPRMALSPRGVALPQCSVWEMILELNNEGWEHIVTRSGDTRSGKCPAYVPGNTSSLDASLYIIVKDGHVPLGRSSLRRAAHLPSPKSPGGEGNSYRLGPLGRGRAAGRARAPRKDGARASQERALRRVSGPCGLASRGPAPAGPRGHRTSPLRAPDVGRRAAKGALDSEGRSGAGASLLHTRRRSLRESRARLSMPRRLRAPFEHQLLRGLRMFGDRVASRARMCALQVPRRAPRASDKKKLRGLADELCTQALRRF